MPIKIAKETKTTSPTVNQKKVKPEVELFVMTHCPYGIQIEKGILPVIKLLDGKIDFEIKFVDYAMHELKEVEESMRQYCIQKDQNQAYLSYLECFLIAGDSATCLKDGGIDQAALQTCIAETDAEFEIMAKYNDKTTWISGRFPEIPMHKAETKRYGIAGSPSFIMNGEKISTGRSPQQLLDTICAGFIEKPEECSVSLSSDNPSPGFGSSASNSGGTANCAP